MPNGRTHTSVTLLTAAYASMFLVDKVVNAGYQPTSLLAIGGCLTGVIVSPDLDVDAGNIGFYFIRRRAGSLPAFLWRAYWYPYSKLIPHRSWVSHLPIVSTAIRVAYLCWWLPLIPGALMHWEQFMWFFVGLALADLNHAFLDFVSPEKEEFK